MKRLLMSLLFLNLFYGCATNYPHLTQEGRSVKFSTRLPPIEYCREGGEVYASAAGKPDEFKLIIRGARNELRNEAARRNANYVTLDTNNSVNHSGQILVAMSGSAFRCSSKKRGEGESEEEGKNE